MRKLGIVLLIAGVLALVYQGFTYQKQNTVLEVGNLEAKVAHDERVDIPPIVGATVLVAGLALVIAARRRTS